MVDEFKSEVVGDVTYIWKRKGLTKKERGEKQTPNVDHVWIPWLLVSKSALLARLGIDSLGLYAATRMKEGTRVGKYKGRVVGRYAKREEALHAPEARDLVLSGTTDKIAALRCEDGPGWCLLDGDAETAPCIPRVNDPTGTGFGENCLLSDYGILRVKAKSGIPAFDPNASLDSNIGSELRWSYGKDFWGLVKQAPGFQAPASKQRQEGRPTPPSKPPSPFVAPSAYQTTSANVSRPNTSGVGFVSPTPSTKKLISVFPDAAFSILTRRTCSDLFLNPDLPLELPTSSSLVLDASRVFMTNPFLNVILNSVVGKQREDTHLILEETELRFEEKEDGTLTLSTSSKLILGMQLVSLKRCPKQYAILPLGWSWVGTGRGHFTFLVLERNELPDSDPKTLVRGKWTAYHVDSNGVGRFYDCLKEAIPTLLSAPIEGPLLPITTTYLNFSDSLYNVLPKPYDNEKQLAGYCKLMGLLLLLDFFCVQDRFFGNDHLKRLFQVILGEGNLFSVDGSTFHLPVLRSFYEKQVKIYLIAFTFKMMKVLFLEKTEEEREKEFGMDLSYEKEFDVENRMRSEKTFFLTLKRKDKEKLERQKKKEEQKNAPKGHTVSWPSTPPSTPIPTPSPFKQTASPSSNTSLSPSFSPSVPVAPIRPLPTCSEEDVSLLSSLPMKVLQSANTSYCKRRSLIDSKFPSLSKASNRGEDEKRRCKEGVVGKTKEELASSLCKMSLHNLPYKVRQAGCSLLKETSDAVSKDVRCNSKKHLLPTLLSSPLPHEVDATVDAALSAGTTFLTHTYSSSERDKLPSLAAASSSSSSTSSGPSLGPRQERLYRNLVGGTHTIHVCLVGWKEGSPLFSAEGWSICFEEGSEREGRSRGVGSLHILSMGGKKGAGISFSPGKGKERVSGFANPYATLALHTLLAKKGFVRVKVGGGSKPRTEKRGKDIAVDPEAPCSRLYETQYLPKREPDRSRMEKYWRGIELVYRTVGFTLTSQGGGEGYTPRLMDAFHFPTKAEVVKRLKEGV